jgi:hypothetical protein
VTVKINPKARVKLQEVKMQMRAVKLSQNLMMMKNHQTKMKTLSISLTFPEKK